MQRRASFSATRACTPMSPTEVPWRTRVSACNTGMSFSRSGWDGIGSRSRRGGYNPFKCRPDQEAGGVGCFKGHKGPYS